MKKNKLTVIKLVVLLAITLSTLSSCGDAVDKKKCLDNVKRVYPMSKIYKVPNGNYSFYVVDSNGVRKVTTFNLFNANIDGITELVIVE